MRLTIKTAISQIELDAIPKTLFRDIFKTICRNLGLYEDWFFGLLYNNIAYKEKAWLDDSKKAIKDFRKACNYLYFKVKYYPEDIAEEIFQKPTIELFFREIHSDITKDNLYCPPETCVLLASYYMQAKHSDFNPEKHGENFFQSQTFLLPERVINQYDIDMSTWTENIVEMWKKHAGMDDEDAMLEYLKLVQNLEMYGNTFFDIENRKGSKCILGVNALGLDVYKPEDRLNPQISFPWSEIKNLKFKDRRFAIKPVDKTAKDFIFLTSDARTSKFILKLGVGNHSLYVKRRKPEASELTRMKQAAKDARIQKKVQKDKLRSEIQAREESERREREYMEKLKKMQEELEESKTNLLEANSIILKLQEQLEELRRAKEELEKQQSELKEMMERLEHTKNMEAEEKLQLEREIQEKQLEVQKIQEAVAVKDEETKRLQSEVELAKQREEELRIQRMKAEEARLEEERRRKEEEAKRRELECELEALPEGANTALPELVEVNDKLREQLKALQEKLEYSRKEEEDTDLDKIHRINLLEGRDKYKTLKDIRRGNTVRRVEMFENM